ncbi:MAG: hypothetical protein KVP17_002562 [Porospora cf. gigantea B]|uniref:uncharacterized protein n=1 Tax=Porospora cf. gigantea B TaxID=2853592 RepID=UPI003571861F|nr:MAG: hypothetical protein KVP17_002562 [Porospora cf. gigantea B]
MPDTDGNVEGDSKQSTEHPDAGGYLEPAGDMSRKENEIESVSRHRKRCRSNPASESPVKKVCREVSRTQDLLALLEEDALKANSTLRLYDRITEDVLSLHAQDAPRSRLTRQALVRACSWIPALIQFDEGGQETCDAHKEISEYLSDPGASTCEQIYRLLKFCSRARRPKRFGALRETLEAMTAATAEISSHEALVARTVGPLHCAHTARRLLTGQHPLPVKQLISRAFAASALHLTGINFVEDPELSSQCDASRPP